MLREQAGLSVAAAQQVLASRHFFPFPEVAGSVGVRTDVFGGGAGFAAGADASPETIDLLRHLFDRDNFAAVVATAGNVPVLDGGVQCRRDLASGGGMSRTRIHQDTGRSRALAYSA